MKKIAAMVGANLRESIRDRLMIGLMVAGAAILLILAFMAPMALGAREKSFHDLGLAWIHLSGFLILILLGAWSIQRERERGIWLSVLTRPVSRFEYLIGRLLGLLGTLCIMVVASAAIYAAIGFLTGVPPLPGLPAAMLYIFLELSLLAGIILLLSCVSGFSMTVFISLALFMAGHLSGDLLRMVNHTENGALLILMKSLRWILPHLEMFRIRGDLVAGYSPDLPMIMKALTYAGCYLTALFIISHAIFVRREIR
jgi:ABC-type transport system involved in multi-copper enzyme maturation permease subunit